MKNQFVLLHIFNFLTKKLSTNKKTKKTNLEKNKKKTTQVLDSRNSSHSQESTSCVVRQKPNHYSYIFSTEIFVPTQKYKKETTTKIELKNWEEKGALEKNLPFNFYFLEIYQDFNQNWYSFSL